jgi:hypothetical protein
VVVDGSDVTTETLANTNKASLWISTLGLDNGFDLLLDVAAMSP